MKRLTYITTAAASVLLVWASTATASTMTGYITDVHWQNGLVYFKYDGERDSFPACANGAPIYTLPFTDGERTLAYDISYHIIQEAWKNARPVVITGKGVCDEWSTYESVKRISPVRD